MTSLHFIFLLLKCQKRWQVPCAFSGRKEKLITVSNRLQAAEDQKLCGLGGGAGCGDGSGGGCAGGGAEGGADAGGGGAGGCAGGASGGAVGAAAGVGGAAGGCGAAAVGGGVSVLWSSCSLSVPFVNVRLFLTLWTGFLCRLITSN